jgi:hypothetical protein
MKRLTIINKRNTGLIPVECETECEQEIIKKLFTALQKFSSSRKTKAVHRILDKGNLRLGIFGGAAADELVAVLSKEAKLNSIVLNLYFFDDSLDRNGAVKYAAQINILQKKIQKEKTYLSEKQLLNIEELKKELKEAEENLSKSVDFIKMIDGIYFGWLLMLSFLAVNGESNGKSKIATTAAEILASILKKMYLQVNTKIEPEVHQLIEAIAIYFMRIYYYGESGQYALNSLKKAFNEETIEAIKLAKVTQFKEFNDLSVILKEAQVLSLTKATFDQQMNRSFGKHGYETYIQASLTEFIAFMANMAHPTQLFKDTYKVDEKLHERLEELVLNEQKKVTFFEFS